MMRSPPTTQKTLSDPQLYSPEKETNAASSNNVMRSEKRRRLSDDQVDELASFKSEVRDMLVQMFSKMSENQNSRLEQIEKRISDVDKNVSFVHNTNKDIELSINYMSGRIDYLQDKIKDIKVNFKDIHTKITSMDEKINIIERSVRKTSIEIRKLAKKNNEKKKDLFCLAQTLLKTLALDNERHNIRDVYRLPSKREAADATLIVEFTNTISKSNVIEAVKKFNRANTPDKLNSSHMGLDGKATPVYISEYSSPMDKRLFYLAREYAKSENYKFCWMVNDRVYIRKKEGDSHILVKNADQLNQMKTNPM